MMALLCITHVVWFIPYATGACMPLQRWPALGGCSPQPPWLLLRPRCLRPQPPLRSLFPPPTPPQAGYYSIEGTGLRYDCQQGTLLRVANYGLFALFALAALNEAAITVLGLRGEGRAREGAAAPAAAPRRAVPAVPAGTAAVLCCAGTCCVFLSGCLTAVRSRLQAQAARSRRASGATSRRCCT